MVAQIQKAMLRMRPLKIPGRLVCWALIEGRPLTTRGRFINAAVFAGYSLAQWTPAARGADQPIFIIGTGRSGTTVLGSLFSMHNETVFLNEPKAIWHHVHGSEDIVGSYTEGPSRIRLVPEEANAKMAKQIAHVYSWAMRWGLARRVVDKYPELVFRVAFVLQLFPKARFIAILRDGVDTCSSVTDWSTRNGETVGQETHDWWGRNRRKWHMIVDELVPEHSDLAPLQKTLRTADDHRDRAAVEWILAMREARKVAAHHPEVLAIRYEDLCADPEPILQQMTEHAGLSSDPIFVDYAKTVLSAADAYRPLELMPELVEPFKLELAAIGYDASIERVNPRKSAS